MHVVFFGLKRAYHGTLRITREPLRGRGLTPARFDLLYAVKECPGGVLQSALRRILGVCRATASKMLISLEELGLVKRTVYRYDRRQRLVRLTGYGRHSIRDAKGDFIRSGWAELAFASAIGSTGLCHWYDQDGCFEQKTWLLERLDALRHGFFDFASLEYSRTHPQLPDDLEDRAFSEPWEDIAAREAKDGANAPPPGAEWTWSRDAVAGDEGRAADHGDARFPWEDEGAATWEEWARDGLGERPGSPAKSAGRARRDRRRRRGKPSSGRPTTGRSSRRTRRHGDRGARGDRAGATPTRCGRR
jgi:DNA-binding MarR family transcriptional regulator